MTRPEQLILAELHRSSRGLDVVGLQRRTKLSMATLKQTLPKLRRMRCVSDTEDTWSITGVGRRRMAAIHTQGAQ